MSKKTFKRTMLQHKVQAVFTHFKKINGIQTDIPLYDLYAYSYR